MPNDFADPNFLVGLKDPLEKPAPDTANRSLGRAAVDTALQVGEGALSFARIPTQMFRNLSDDPNGNAAAVDRAVGGAQEYVNKELISPAGQAIATNKWMPTQPGDRSAMNQPVATAISDLTGLVPSIAVGAMTGGGGPAGLALFGAQGASDALAQVRDYTDQTPKEELLKFEPFRAAMREFNGDEAAARNKLFKDSVDVWDVAINAAANAAEFGTVVRAMAPAKQELVGFLQKRFLGRAGVGAVEGAAGGVAEGLASETTQQRAKVKMGVQPDVDVAEILSSGFETGVAMAPGVAGLSAARRGHRPATALNTDVAGVAKEQTAPAPPPPPQQALQPNAPPVGEQYGPENMLGPFQPPPPPGGAAGPAGQVPPPTGLAPTPTAGPPPAGAAGQGTRIQLDGKEGSIVTPRGNGVDVRWDDGTSEYVTNERIAAATPVTEQTQAATPPGVVTDPAAAGTVADPNAPVPTPTEAGPAAATEQQAPLTPGVTPTQFYVDPATFDDKPLRFMSIEGGPKREVAFDPAVGRWGIRLLEGPKAGQFHPKLYFDAETDPRPGLAPVNYGPGTPPTYGDLIEEGVPATADAPPAATAEVAPLTPEEQAQYERITGTEPATESEIAAQALVADEPRVAPPAEALTPEEQAQYDAIVAAEEEKPAPGRDKRRAERKAEMKKREEAPRKSDAQLIEEAKTETRRRVEAAAAEAREREQATTQTERTGPFAATPLGAREGTGEVLAEAARRVSAKSEEATLQEENLRQLARGPRARLQVLSDDIRRYVRAPSVERYRELRARIMGAPLNVRERLIGMLGQQPTTEEDARRATPQRRPFKERPFKGMPETVPVKQATPTDRPAPTPPRMGPPSYKDHLDDLAERRGMPARQFFQMGFVKNTLDRMNEMNAARKAAGDPLYPFPLWLQEKYNELGDKEKAESFNWLAEGTPYIKAAQTLKLRTRDVTPDTKRQSASNRLRGRKLLETTKGREDVEKLEQEERSATIVSRAKIPELQEKAQERLTKRHELTARREEARNILADTLMKQGMSETEARAAAAERIPLLRERLEGRGKRQRRVSEQQPSREALPQIVIQEVEDAIDREANKASTTKTREKRYVARERVIDYAFNKVMNKLGGKAEFVALLQKARGFTRDERHPELLPDGTPHPKAWRALASEYPKTPKILERRASARNRLHDDTIDRFRDIEAAHMKRVDAYWQAKGEQLAAVNQLQPVIDDMLKETGQMLTAAKERMGIKGRSIFFSMPSASIEDYINDKGVPSRRMRITVGKAVGDRVNMFKTMIELFKVNEDMKRIRAGTAESRFRQPDIMSTMSKTAESAREMQVYMRRMDKATESAGLYLTSWLNRDFQSMLELIKLRSDLATEKFNQTPSETVDQEGEFVNRLDNVAMSNVYDANAADPMDQLSIEEAAMEEGRRQREEDEAVERARATQIDRLRAMLEQARGVNDPVRRAKLEELVAKAEAVLTKHNGNRRASPIYGHEPQSIKEVAREIANARTELDESNPESPLISMPEHAAETMDRVKNLISTGQAAVSRFVTPQFLDKLANVLVAVPTIHTTTSVTNGQMYYQTDHDRIVLVNDTDAQSYAQGAVHEAVHAATEHLLDNDAAFTEEVNQLLGRARAYAKRTNMNIGHRDLYGLKDNSEFLAEAISNEKFRQFLNRIPTPGVSPIRGVRTALNGLYRVIRDVWQRVMGTQKDADTALDALFYDQSEVLGHAEKLVTRSVESLRQQGRRPRMGNRAMPPLASRFADAVKDAGPAALEKIKNTRDNLQRDRGLGLSIHSTYDLTTRAEPAFREKTSDVLDVASMIFRERQRILQEEDQPILLKINQFLNALAPTRRKEFEDLMIDETMHSAYVDAPLFTDKNRHIDQHSLADEQVRQQHADLQHRWNQLAGTEAEIKDDKGRRQKVTAASIRDDAHKYFAERENQIREVIIKHTLERSDVLPENLPTSQHDAALNRMIAYIFPKPMSDADLRDFRKAEREKLKTDYGIDLSNPKIREQIADLRNEDALKRIEGPYFPLTRHGDYAVHGVFRIKPDDATRYPEKIHWQTKRPIDDGTFLFDDIDAARDAIRDMSDKYGIAQIGGGEVWIDTRTGERVMEYTPRELEVDRELAELRGNPEPRNRRLTKKEIEEGAKKGKPYVKKYEVKMQNRILEYHATEAEAQASINDWKAKHAGVLDINSEPEDVRKGTGKENEQYVSQQMQRVIDRFEGSRSYRAQSDADQRALKHALTTAAAKSVMRRGVRARFTTRNYVKGSSRDVIRNMADYSGSTAGYLAKMKHMTQIDEKTKALRDYVDDQHDAKGHQARTRVANELLERLHEPTQSMVETTFSRAVDRILKFTMFDKLMGLGYFAINATEPTLIAGPLMAGKHSAAAIAREIRTAYGMYGAFKFAGYGARDFLKAARGQRDYTNYQQKFLNAIRGKNDESELLGLYNHLTKLGLFEATAGVEYQRLLMLQSQGRIDQVGDYLTNLFQGLNTSVENLSRFVTATAAYRLERRAGRSVEEATKYARDIVYEAHGQYANFNAPELFNRNPVFKLALQFKKYPQRIAANYIRAITGSLGAVKALASGKKPTAEQVMRARQFGMMLAMQGLAAGVMGMPTEPFSIPINALHILGIVPFNWDDVEDYGRKKLADAVGPTGGELISHGILRLLPWDVSGRLAQNGMLVYGSPGSTKVQDLQKSAFGIVAGAGGSWTAEMIGAAQKGSEAMRAYFDGATEVGNKKAMEAFKLGVPVRAVADIIDAIQRSTPEGMQNQRGAQMREPYGVGEAIGALAGFRPKRESEQMEQRRTVQRAITVYGRERKEIIDHWAQSGPAERESQWRMIQQRNAGLPDAQRIKREDLLRALNVRTKAGKQSPESMGLPTDKRTQSFIDQTRGVYNY